MLFCCWFHVYSYFINTGILIFSFLGSSSSSLLAQALAKSTPRRPRGENRPIPDEQKDRRYYERRKRNNLAAKKSRDQRKQREETIAGRARFLERENSVLRAQMASLKEERSSLHQTMWLRRYENHNRIIS